MTTIPEIIIASRRDATAILDEPDRRGIRHVLSIGEPGSSAPLGFWIGPLNRLRVEFDDATNKAGERAGYVLPSSEDVRRIIEFLEGVHSKILIHCAAGVSRSAAAACILVTLKLGPGLEKEALRHVSRVKQSIWPNKRILHLADVQLGRGGKLLQAAIEMWKGRDDELDMVMAP